MIILSSTPTEDRSGGTLRKVLVGLRKGFCFDRSLPLDRISLQNVSGYADGEWGKVNFFLDALCPASRVEQIALLSWRDGHERPEVL